jgi:uncharacterized protein
MATTTPDTIRTQSATSIGFVARYLAIGAYFGFVLVKAEVLSWYRIQEMFRFHSFHMYGVIGLAILVGLVTVALVKRHRLRAADGSAITFADKDRSWARYLLGGSLFGLGWALTGACPGPIAALIGAGLTGFTVVLVAAVLGTYTYGLLRHRLPH